MNAQSLRTAGAELAWLQKSRKTDNVALHFLVTILAIAVGLTFVPGAASAQDESRWNLLYRRVRIVTTDDSLRRFQGTIREISGDTLRLEPHFGGTGDILILKASVRSIQISVGQESHELVGALLGGIAGAVISYTAIATSEENAFYMNEQAPRTIALSAAGGALAGAIIGSLLKTDRWQDVPLSRSHVSFRPNRAEWTFIGGAVSF